MSPEGSWPQFGHRRLRAHSDASVFGGLALRYTRWMESAHFSSNGRNFDVGIATRAALERWKKTKSADGCGEGERRASNGSIMRLAPATILWYVMAHARRESMRFDAVRTRCWPPLRCKNRSCADASQTRPALQAHKRVR